MAKRNRYARQASKQAMIQKLSSRLDTKGDIKHSAMETGKDLVVGVLIGGLSAALIGKPAFLVGLGITGLGHYAGNNLASTLGLGMMAAGNIVGGAVSGIDGLDGVKERVQAFRQSIMERTYLDKIMKKKDVAVSGFGNLQYFDYAQMQGIGATDNPELYGDMGDIGNTDEIGDIGQLAALNAIEQQVANAGMARMEMQGIGMGDFQPEVGALEPDLDGLGDVEDYNF